MSKTTAAVLEKAAEYIEQNGWCSGAFFDPRGQACLAGAVGVASGYLKPKWENKGKRGGTVAWNVSEDARKIKKYQDAIHVLSGAIPRNPDLDTLTQKLNDFDAETLARADGGHYYDETQENFLQTRARHRKQLIEDHVTIYNDRIVYGNDTTTVRRKTTKTQALKVLRKAAAVANA